MEHDHIAQFSSAAHKQDCRIVNAGIHAAHIIMLTGLLTTLVWFIPATVYAAEGDGAPPPPRDLLRQSLMNLSHDWSDGAVDSLVNMVTALAVKHRGELTSTDASRISQGLQGLPNFQAITPDTHPLVAQLVNAQLRYSVERYLTDAQPNQQHRGEYVKEQTALINKWAQQAVTLMPAHATVIDAGKRKAIDDVTRVAANVLLDEGRESPPPDLLATVDKEWSNDDILNVLRTSTDPDVLASHVAAILRRGLNPLREHSLGKLEPPPEYYRLAKSAYEAAIPEIREWYDRKGIEATDRIHREQRFRDEVVTPVEGFARESIGKTIDSLGKERTSGQELPPIPVTNVHTTTHTSHKSGENPSVTEHIPPLAFHAGRCPIAAYLGVIGGVVLIVFVAWYIRHARRDIGN